MKINKKTIEKLKNGDESVFNQIYYEFEGLVYYICYSITYNKEVSEDLTQETFIKLLNSISSYEEKGKFKQYIMMIARNLAKNYVTRTMDAEIFDDALINDYIEEDNNRKNAKFIIEMETLLDKEEAHIIILKLVYNFTFKEIALDMNKTLGEIQAMYYKALEKVKEKIL